MKDFFKILTIILFCVGIVAIVIFCCYAEVKQSIEHWNNGICENCGGEYKFSGATHIKNGGDIITIPVKNVDIQLKLVIL